MEEENLLYYLKGRISNNPFGQVDLVLEDGEDGGDSEQTSSSSTSDTSSLDIGMETLQALAANPKNATAILDHYVAVFNNGKCRERVEVLDYLPPIAFLLSEDGTDEELRSLITSHLLQLVVKALNDDVKQISSMGESALLTLLEHCLIPSECIEREVWPAILQRVSKSSGSPAVISAATAAAASSDSLPSASLRLNNPPSTFNKDKAANIIELVNKMALWVGVDLCERLIVPFVERLSAEPDLNTRRAFLYGDLCSVVSSEVAETRLVPSFLKLCADPQWVVRQTCAEVFMSVACKVSLAARKNLLAPVFARLLTDETKWVQLYAFQSLGPFITTLADPSITSLAYSHNGDLVLTHKVQKRSFEYKLEKPSSWSLKPSAIFDANREISVLPYKPGGGVHGMQPELDTTPPPVFTPVAAPPAPSSSPQPLALSPSSEDEKFNSWQYWREPLPQIELAEGGGTADEEEDEPPPPSIFTSDDIDATETELSRSACNEEFVNSIIKEFKELNQNLEKTGAKTNRGTGDGLSVPAELIELFVSMPDRKLTPGLSASDLATHCAYNLPAVALTLGKDHWRLLKPAYETLATDAQWKVRRIVACSIHELAQIVGEDVATEDLVPIFNGFIKDLDEVRIGALKHLARFLKVLRPAGRNTFLPRLTEFLMTDYDWNWRFRQELAEQLHQSLGLFSPADTCHHLGPVIIALLLDKVAAVRKVALALVTELVSHVSIDVSLLRSLLAELAEQFAHSSRWNRRQTFAYLSSELLTKRVLSEEMYARDLLPHLLDLSWDPVPNVRLAVARTASQYILPNPYFSEECSPHHEVLMTVLKRLQTDKDRDVRYFASFQPPQPISSEGHQGEEEQLQEMQQQSEMQPPTSEDRPRGRVEEEAEDALLSYG